MLYLSCVSAIILLPPDPPPTRASRDRGNSLHHPRSGSRGNSNSQRSCRTSHRVTCGGTKDATGLEDYGDFGVSFGGVTLLPTRPRSRWDRTAPRTAQALAG